MGLGLGFGFGLGSGFGLGLGLGFGFDQSATNLGGRLGIEGAALHHLAVRVEGAVRVDRLGEGEGWGWGEGEGGDWGEGEG